MKKEYTDPILNWAQAISDWCQMTFGFNNFKIARALKLLAIICFCFYNLVSFYFWGPTPFLTIFLITGIYFFCMDYHQLKRAEDICQRNYVNPLVKNQEWSRRTFKILVIFTITNSILLKTLFVDAMKPSELLYNKIIEFPNYGIWILAMFSLYFQACTPKPPSESKVRKWINNTKGALSPKKQLIPA